MYPVFDVSFFEKDARVPDAPAPAAEKFAGKI
jgi:hypothetical protein